MWPATLWLTQMRLEACLSQDRKESQGSLEPCLASDGEGSDPLITSSQDRSLLPLSYSTLWYPLEALALKVKDGGCSLGSSDLGPHLKGPMLKANSQRVPT